MKTEDLLEAHRQWMEEVTGILCYLSAVPHDHKEQLANAMIHVNNTHVQQEEQNAQPPPAPELP